MAEIDYLLDYTIPGRRFFITRKGYMGIGPAEMEVGNHVYIFMGGTMPFVLRDRGKPHDNKRKRAHRGECEACRMEFENRFALVGDCFVQGIMDGEGVGDPHERRNNVDVLYLR